MSFDDDFDLDRDILETEHIRSSMENREISISSIRNSISNHHELQRQTENITECFVNEVFANKQYFEEQVNPPYLTLPYVHNIDVLPVLMENTLFYRFRNNQLIQKAIRCDIHHCEFEVMHSTHACAAPVENERYVVSRQLTFRKCGRYSVRVVKYEKREPKKRIPEEYEIPNDVSLSDEPETPISLQPDEAPVLVFHDFHQHPMMLKQLASELETRTVIIPSMHDLLSVANIINPNEIILTSVEILLKMFAGIAKVQVIGHGIGCIIAEMYCNERRYGEIIMCNPPPRFRYIFQKEQVVKMSKMVEVNNSFTAPSDLCVPHSGPTVQESDVYKEQIRCNTVMKQFCITPNGNREHVCGDYSKGIAERCETVQQQQYIKLDHDYVDFCNGFLHTEYQYLGRKIRKMRISAKFRSQMDLQETILKTSRQSLKNLLLNLLIFAPLSIIYDYMQATPLFNAAFFEAMPVFARVLDEEMPVIPLDGRQKYIVFAANYAFAEVETMNFFKQVDKNDGDIYCKTVIGCGYDMFQCVPQVISRLVFNIAK